MTTPEKPAESLPTTCSPADQAEAVFKWVISGASEHDIAEAVKANFGADARALLAEVMARLERSSQFETSVVIGWCIEATRDLYRRMVEIGDFAGALRAVKQMVELTRHVQHRPEEEGAEGEGIRSLPAEETGSPPATG